MSKILQKEFIIFYHKKKSTIHSYWKGEELFDQDDIYCYDLIPVLKILENIFGAPKLKKRLGGISFHYTYNQMVNNAIDS